MSTEDCTPDREKPKRFVSVDALRGFDMFWILGAGGLAHALPLTDGRIASQLDDQSAQGLTGVDRGIYLFAEQLEHVGWEGFHFYDLIFPLFVFLMGVSTVFSLGRIVEQHGKKRAYGRLFRRVIVLFLLGILYYGVDDDGQQFRYLGVLQRIAVCYLFGGLLFLNFRWRGLLLSSVLLLGSYWALMSFVAVPGHGAANWEVGTNLANYIDTHYLGGYKWNGDWDPEGLLSTMPAIVSGILGIFGGMLLKNPNLTGSMRAILMLAIGGACLGGGYGWAAYAPLDYNCPIIKTLWTPSFVLFAGGWSFVLLGIFHFIIDVMKFDFWARPFVWIGANAITLYMLNNFVWYGSVVERVTEQSWIAARLSHPEITVSALATLVPVGIAWVMYRNKAFIRV